MGFKYIFLLFLLYMGYQLIFRFILPVFRATSVMRQKVNDMQSQRQQFEQNASSSNMYNPSSQKVNVEEPKRAKEGEYIEFEEIK